jgi:sugar lactone lactonase YvrE
MHRSTRSLPRIALLAALTLAALAPAAQAQPAGGMVTVASGLNNPRGVEVGPGGAVYVAEAGRGGDNCISQDTCIGFTAAITRIKAGHQQRVAGGLLSVAGSDGSFATGANDVGVGSDGSLYTVITGAPPDALQGLPAAVRSQLGRLLQLRPGGGRSVVADLARWEIRFNPDGTDVNPNPYGVAVTLNGIRYALDAGGNTLYGVGADGRLFLVAILPPQTVGGRLVQSVPTGLTVGPDAALYVGEFGGDGLPDNRARVFRIVPPSGEVKAVVTPQIIATGFTHISGLAFGRNGTLFVTEQFRSTGGLQRGDFTGSLWRVPRNGARSEIARGQLMAPGGVDVADDGSIYVSVNSVFPGNGAVVRLGG